MTKRDTTERYAIKPPLEHPTPNHYVRWKRGQKIGTLVALLMILAVIVLFVTTRASAFDHWLCDYTNALTVYPHVQTVQYIPEAHTWVDMPSDLGESAWLFLPLTEEVQSGYHLEFSPSAQELWIWPYWSLDLRSDPDGRYMGTHDSCPVLKIDLSK